MCAVDYYGRRHGAFPALEEDFMFSFKKIQKNKFGKKIALFSLAVIFSIPVLPNTTNTYAALENATVMENCGAYLFTWRPVDCGNGEYFVILNGQNTMTEGDVILNRGYDYAYTFDSSYSKPWGQVPDLVNVNGLWGVPSNWGAMPAGAQAVSTIVLVTNNGNSSTRERYVHVTHLPDNVSVSQLPPEVRKFVINTDGSDAGAYDDTDAAGWIDTEAGRMYLKPDGTYVSGGWLVVDEESYYMDANGIMLKDTITPDGVYVDANGQRRSYKPGWFQDGENWRYIGKSGYYTANAWVQDIDGKWYYFNMGGVMVADDYTPDGYYVDASGAWDGQPANLTAIGQNPGPGAALQNEGWQESAGSWRYCQADGTYVSNGWFQAPDGKWYYFGADSIMWAGKTTPDGYYVDASGAWDGQPANTEAGV